MRRAVFFFFAFAIHQFSYAGEFEDIKNFIDPFLRSHELTCKSEWKAKNGKIVRGETKEGPMKSDESIEIIDAAKTKNNRTIALVIVKDKAGKKKNFYKISLKKALDSTAISSIYSGSFRDVEKEDDEPNNFYLYEGKKIPVHNRTCYMF